MFYLSLRLVILVYLIFQPVKVFVRDDFSFWCIYFSHFGVRHKIDEAVLDPVIHVIYKHMEWHYPSLAMCCQFIFIFCYLRPVFIKTLRNLVKIVIVLKTCFVVLD